MKPSSNASKRKRFTASIHQAGILHTEKPPTRPSLGAWSGQSALGVACEDSLQAHCVYESICLPNYLSLQPLNSPWFATSFLPLPRRHLSISMPSCLHPACPSVVNLTSTDSVRPCLVSALREFSLLCHSLSVSATMLLGSQTKSMQSPPISINVSTHLRHANNFGESCVAICERAWLTATLPKCWISNHHPCG